MTIRDQQAYWEGVWDWSFLDDCFGTTNIKPTDIDGAIERNGKYLFIETKRPDVNIPVGQAMFYDGLILAGYSVLFIWGKKNQPCGLRIVTPHIDKLYKTASMADVQQVVGKWFEWADSQEKIKHGRILNPVNQIVVEAEPV